MSSSAAWLRRLRRARLSGGDVRVGAQRIASELVLARAQRDLERPEVEHIAIGAAGERIAAETAGEVKSPIASRRTGSARIQCWSRRS